ncbi:ATP-binding cassette domain-containing protein [Petroclostridium sp. X23]|uniref:ATP-binding cassette domain-containing protein n=1 Tax=Petroclostridium sp. X23 TaxID=3045146 RepID=UPI0032BF21D0
MKIQYNTGQQQRVAIARALMNDSPLILADEPTGNLDSESTEQAYSLLRNINRHKGTTFVIVNHDMHIAAKSDRIIEILDGQIKRDFMIEKNRREVWNNISPCNCFLKREE